MNDGMGDGPLEVASKGKEREGIHVWFMIGPLGIFMAAGWRLDGGLVFCFWGSLSLRAALIPLAGKTSVLFITCWAYGH